jgi:tetratricopeptide (TPR) repeat protein
MDAMASEFQPTSSKEFFVGREDKLDVFHAVWSGQRPEWIIYIPGEGGIGKTRLLQRYREKALEWGDVGGALSTNLIDFYHTANQSRLGLLQEVACQLGLEQFPLFSQARHDYEERRGDEREVFDAFFVDYRNLLLTGQKILLLFDTCEEMHGVQSWVLDGLLENVYQEEKRYATEKAGGDDVDFNSRTVIVMAGRPPLLEFPKPAWVIQESLDSLKLEAVQDYYQRDPEVGSMVDNESLKKLYDKTGGKPLYVALSFDWLKNDVGTLDELLDSPEPFGAELVGWVRRLGPEKKLAILGMALGWRRMETSLFQRLVGLDEKKVKKLIEELSRFSFIKYRPADEYSAINLHDEMRYLINRYVWPREWESRSEEIQLLSQIVEWYQGMIGDDAVLGGEKPPQHDRQRALLAELLFYKFQIDINEAANLYEALFRRGIHFDDMGYSKLLNEEVMRFETNLTREQQDDLIFRRALAAFKDEEYRVASDLWTASLRSKDLKLKVRATTILQLVELEVYTGKPNAAMLHAQEGEEYYKTLISTERHAKEKAQLQLELGQLYNNWGYAHRMRGEFHDALTFYEKALKTSRRSQLPEKHRARVLNNMGYIHFLMGNTIQARSYVGRALSIRIKLNIPYELGLGSNTMGMLMEDYGHISDAVDLYHRAFNAFESANSRRGRAMALLNLGRIERIANDYEKAFEHLEKARNVFERWADKENLLKAYNELGCTYRQRREPGELEMAIDYLNKSLDLSIELGKFFDQADTMEDISVAYYLLSQEVGVGSKSYQEYAKLASDYARKVIQLIGKSGSGYQSGYLIGKTKRTLGDLAYWDGDYKEAFDDYFDGCRKIAGVWKQGKEASVFMQRQYEGMLDRMQERLHGLNDTEKILKYVKHLLDKLNGLSPEEKKVMKKMKEYLNTTKETARLVG